MLENNVKLMTRGMVLIALVLGGMLAAYPTGAAWPPAAIPPAGGCGNTINYDEGVTGAVVKGDVKCYAFEGREGDRIMIMMMRLDAPGDLDPFLELRGPDWGLLASDNNSFRDNDSLIVFELQQSGAYFILAGSYQGLSAGLFRLVLARLVCGGPIAYGQEVFSQVPPGAGCIYTFAGHAGEVVGIQLLRRAGALQPHVEVVAPDGSIVDSHDGDTGNLIEDYALQTDGTYMIGVAVRDGQGTGAFNLTLWRKDACGGEPNRDESPSVGVIQKVDRAEISTLTPRCYYTFSSYGGEDISVHMTAESGNLKPEFQVFGPDGVAVSDVTDHWDGVGLDGTYTIIALGQEGTAGRFKLVIFVPTGIRARLKLCSATLLESGDMVNKKVFRGLATCTPRFEGTAGDVVTILMTRLDSELDPYLWLYAGDSSIAETQDDDSAGDSNSLINQYRLKSSGEYRIVPGSYNNASSGEYYLSFWRMH